MRAMNPSEMYTIPPIQSYQVPSDTCYAPSAPMQSILPPPSYSISTAPVPYGAVPPATAPMYPTTPMLFTPIQVPYQGVLITSSIIPPQTAHIRDYMVWSKINLLLGGIFLGIIAIVLSSQTRRRKQDGDVEGARTLSNLTLTCNILITIVFFATTAFVIIYFVIILSSSLEDLYK